MFFLIPFTVKSIQKAEFERNICIECDYILPLKHVLWAVLLCKYQTFPPGHSSFSLMCVYMEK